MNESLENLTMDRIVDGFNSTANLPGYLRISLLENCNESCYFCHNEGYDSRTTKINPEMMWSVIEASASIGKNKFKFTGGEPTLDPNLSTYVSAIKKRFPTSSVGIVTNATKMDELAYELKESGLDSIIISLHSLDKQNYKKITQLDGYEQSMKGMKAIDDAGFKDVTINTVVGKPNVKEVYQIIEFANDRNYALRLLDILPGNPSLDKVAIPSAQLQQMFPQTVIKPKIYHDKCNGCKSIPICGEGEYLRLSARGTLDPCMYREDLKINVHSQEPQTLIEKKVALGFRRIQKDDI